MAWAVDDVDASLAVPVFGCQVVEDGFLAPPPLPSNWSPGMRLRLRGPIGNGFRMPENTRRLALAGLGGSALRLLPLAHQALSQGAAVVLYCDVPPLDLPLDVEIGPIRDLPETLAWSDYLALEVPMANLPDILPALGLSRLDVQPACRVEVLIAADMPCGGLAECGVCAVGNGGRWKLACKDGPVFSLDTLRKTVFRDGITGS
jgi:dihydroorotate dehydrogenase electron transfer subunit